MTRSRNLYHPRNILRLCSQCGEKAYAKNLCKKHYMKMWEDAHIEYRRTHYWNDSYRSKQKQHRQSLRADVIREYGGKCCCLNCPEVLEEFLTIDHIDGSGAEQRRIDRKTGWRFYQWLRDNGYPKDNFQLLCMNCNWAKHAYGVCPHQNKEQGSNKNDMAARRIRKDHISGQVRPVRRGNLGASL